MASWDAVMRSSSSCLATVNLSVAASFLASCSAVTVIWMNIFYLKIYIALYVIAYLGFKLNKNLFNFFVCYYIDQGRYEDSICNFKTAKITFECDYGPNYAISKNLIPHIEAFSKDIPIEGLLLRRIICVAWCI